MAEMVATQMQDMGLADVHFEKVPVHAWRFRDATVTLESGKRYAGASMAGAPRTRGNGVTAEVVLVGTGRRDRLDRIDLRGKIALVDWRLAGPWIGEIGMELGLRGTRAVIVASLENGMRFRGEGALGTSVAQSHDGAPPLVTLRQADARDLIQRCRAGRVQATVAVDLETDRRARGRNVCGVLHPELPGAPVVVGAHHDGWFYGAFDNASGVASMLTIAKGLIKAGWRPSRPVWFVSHTAEEFGRMDDDQPWCVGAWHQVAVEHPQWGTTVPFYLDVEASGRSEFPLVVLGPAELRRFATRWCRAADVAGLLPKGWKFAGPSTGTHQWPFQLAGVPGLSVLNWHTDFERSDYHTDNDTYKRLDFGYLANLTRLYGSLLVDAEAMGDRLLDYRARVRDVERAAAKWPDGDQASAAARRYAPGSRRAFARLARRGIAVDTHGETGYLPEQAARDARLLADAIAAIDAGDRAAAVRAAEKVGRNRLQRWVSPDVQARSERRHVDTHGSWPEKSHLTTTPHLWNELASLRGEPAARPYGPWVRRSFERSRQRMQGEARARIARLAVALSA